MKRTLMTLGFLGMMSSTALAGNTVEDALKDRKDLSVFYQALVNTGVINELNNGPYTIFAPTNEAFSQITQDKYPCFYSNQCREEVATILRHHIVPAEEHVSDVVRQKGGVYSINDRYINIAEPYKQHFTADGHEIETQNQLLGGVLYRIDGVIANESEMAEFRTMKEIPVTVLPTTTEKIVTEKTYYLPSEARLMPQSTTVTRTITTEPVPNY